MYSDRDVATMHGWSWANAETRAVFLEMAVNYEDQLTEIVSEWQELCGAGAAEQFATQLRRDFEELYCGNSEGIVDFLLCAGFRRVNWDQAAERLIQLVETGKRKAEA